MINAFIGFSQKLEDVVSRSVNKGSSRVESKSIVLINLLMSDKSGGGSQRKRKWCCCSGRDFPAPDLDFAPITWLVFLQSPQLSSAQHSFLISLFLSMKISVNETESRFLVENTHRQFKKKEKKYYQNNTWKTSLMFMLDIILFDSQNLWRHVPH